jgi:hypothetical protein
MSTWQKHALHQPIHLRPAEPLPAAVFIANLSLRPPNRAPDFPKKQGVFSAVPTTDIVFLWCVAPLATPLFFWSVPTLTNVLAEMLWDAIISGQI